MDDQPKTEKWRHWPERDRWREWEPDYDNDDRDPDAEIERRLTRYERMVYGETGEMP